MIAVDSRLSRSVAVVEHVFGIRVVDRYDGKLEHAFFRHAPQANDTRRRLFGTAQDFRNEILSFGQNRGYQVGPVIHGDLRVSVESRKDVAVVGLVVFALDGEGGDLVLFHQSRRDVVLCAERIRRADGQRRRRRPRRVTARLAVSVVT